MGGGTVSGDRYMIEWIASGLPVVKAQSPEMSIIASRQWHFFVP
jgi:hypothetical protein